MTRLIGKTAFLAMLQAVERGKRQSIAATNIQKIVRGFLVRKRGKRQRIAAINIQKIVRGFLVRNPSILLTTEETEFILTKRPRDDEYEYVPIPKKYRPNGAAMLACGHIPESTCQSTPILELVRQTAVDGFEPFI